MRHHGIVIFMGAAFASVACANPPLPANVTVSPEPVEFGRVYVGDTKALSATLANNRGRALPVQASSVGAGTVFVVGAAPPALPQSLANGATLAFPFRFTPPAAGAHTGVWRLTVAAVTHNVELRGEGVLGWWDETVGVTGFTAATGLDFGNVLVGTTTPHQEVQVRNVSANAIVFNALPASTHAAFAVTKPVAGDLPVTLQPPLAGRGMQKVRVTFTPRSVGPHTGVLTWTDSTGKVILKVQLSGVGVLPEGQEGE